MPPQVALNVRRFIQICRARKRATGSLSLALAPDTNVNTSTSAQTVNIFGLPFQLDDQARATSGIGVVAAFGFTLTGAQQYFLTDFDQPNALLSPEPPHTRLWFTRAALHNRKIQVMGFSPALCVIREDRSSNLTPYQHQRYRAQGGVVRVF